MMKVSIDVCYLLLSNKICFLQMAKPKDHSQNVNDYESKRDGNNEESNFYSTGEREWASQIQDQTNLTQIVF